MRFNQWVRELFARIWAKIKLPIWKFLVFSYCLIGMISVLNWSIKVFAEAGEFYFTNKSVIIENVNGAVVPAASLAEPQSDQEVLKSLEGETSVSLSIGEIVEKVYQLESSKGKNVLCPQGKFNGFGYRQNKSEWVCYDTQEEPRQLVMNWFDEKLEKHTLKESLCLYNRGVITEECEYAQKFFSI